MQLGAAGAGVDRRNSADSPGTEMDKRRAVMNEQPSVEECIKALVEEGWQRGKDSKCLGYSGLRHRIHRLASNIDGEIKRLEGLLKRARAEAGQEANNE